MLNHAFFGAFEALYDYWSSRKKISLLAITGFLGHFFFGYMTLVGIKYFGYTTVGVFFGYLPHLIWNLVTIKMVNIDSN